ncbi:MAG: hypothetical protein ACYDH5_06660 [Acidimicrobiales bacterium]
MITGLRANCPGSAGVDIGTEPSGRRRPAGAGRQAHAGRGTGRLAGHRLGRRPVLLALAGVVLAGCSGSPSHAAAPTKPASTTTSAPAVATVSPVAAQVLQAWRYDQSTIESAYRQANANDPLVGTAATGPYLKSVIALLYQMQHAGWVGVGQTQDLHPHVQVAGASSAYVTWCQWESEIVIDKVTRKPAPGLLGEPDYALVRAHLVYAKDYQGDTTWLMRRSVNVKLQAVSGPNPAVERQVCGSYA